MQNTSDIPNLVDHHKDDLIGLADRVWTMPETLYAEFRSCAEHTKMLHEKGFRVTENVAARMPSAAARFKAPASAVASAAGDNRSCSARDAKSPALNVSPAPTESTTATALVGKCCAP